MATPEELRRQQEENELLEKENEILRRRLELQNESYSLLSKFMSLAVNNNVIGSSAEVKRHIVIRQQLFTTVNN